LFSALHSNPSRSKKTTTTILSLNVSNSFIEKHKYLSENNPRKAY
jgi:hypothetical protein